MANFLVHFGRIRTCLHLCRAKPSKLLERVLLCRYQRTEELRRCTTLSVRTFSVSRHEDFDNDDDGDDKEMKFRIRQSRRKHIKSKSSATQKGGDTVVRPSRYLFSDLGKGVDELWSRSPQGSASNRSRKDWYTKQMVYLVSENKVDQAQELLNAMKSQNIKPTVEVFNILITGYGKTGRMRKAFHIYNNIKKMGLQPSGYTYTSLFHIYSQLSNPEVALTQTLQLWEEFQSSVNSQDITPDIITYNCALKAAASTQSLSLAMDIYQDLCSKKLHPDSRTYSTLLSACAKDCSSDQVHWILDEMKSQNIKPDIFVFNAILKALRNSRSTPSDNSSQEASDMFPSGEYGMSDILPDADYNATTTSVFTGIEDFLQLMAINEVIPDIRTFHLLLQVADMDVQQEDYVLQVLKDWQLQPDLPILNAIVKRRAFWGDVTKAWEYIKMFKEEYGVLADRKIYASLAGGCRRIDDGLPLLKEMKLQGFTPDVAVYTKLIKNAIYHGAFQYLTELLKEMKKDHIKPTDRLLELLDEVVNTSHEKHSRNSDKQRKREIKKHKFAKKQLLGFNGFYKTWKYDMSLSSGEEKPQNIHRVMTNKDDVSYEHL